MRSSHPPSSFISGEKEQNYLGEAGKLPEEIRPHPMPSLLLESCRPWLYHESSLSYQEVPQLVRFLDTRGDDAASRTEFFPLPLSSLNPRTVGIRTYGGTLLS